jgi:hypothetical protein
MVVQLGTSRTGTSERVAKRTAASLLVLALTLAVPSLAPAATIGLSVEVLSALSDSVVLARVTGTTARQLPASGADRGAIVTDVDLAVEQVLKGSRPVFYRLTVPGGTVGDLTFVVDEAPGFAPGERCLLFLGASGGLQGGLSSKLTVIDDSVPALSQSLNDVLARIASGVQGYRITAGALALAGSITAPAAGPVVTSIAPQGAVVSPTSTVTIAGRGFGATRGTVAFYPYTYTDLEGVTHQIGGTVSGWSDTTITCSMPDYASSGPVVVTAGGIKATGFPFLAGYSYAGIRVFGSSLTYRLNPNCLDSVDEAALASMARASWSGVSGFSFVDGGACSTVDTPTVMDGRNDIFWSNSFPAGTDVLAYNSYWVAGSYLVESDIVLNDHYAWGDGTGADFDVASVLAHELGHGLVLGDQYGNGDRNKVMCGGISISTQKRALAAEDIAGIRAVYGGTPTLSGSTIFNRGSLYTSSTVVPVVSSISGATKMRTFNGAAFSPSMYAYSNYAADASLSVPAADGPYAVKAEFRNASTGDAIVRYATVVLDRVAPAGTMVLDGGASSATTVAVTADSSIDDTGPVEMRFSVNGRATWSAWEQYAATKALSLPTGNGAKTVYAQYRDGASNAIERSDSITLAVPVVPSTSASVNGVTYATGSTTPWLASASVTLSVDPPSATIWYRVGAAGTQTYGGAFGTGGDGIWQVEYWSGGTGFATEPTRSITVRVDGTPPHTVIDVADGAVVYGVTVTATLAATDTVSGVVSTAYSVNGGPEVSGSLFATSTPATYVLSYHSHDAAGNAEAPNSVTFRIFTADCVTPADLAATQAELLPGVDLTWTDSSDNEIGFEVERAQGASGAWAGVASLSAGTQSWTDGLAGISPEEQWRSTWRYRVRSVTPVAGSPWTAPVSIHLAGPSPVTSLVVNGEPVGDGAVTPWLRSASMGLVVDVVGATSHYRVGSDDATYAAPFGVPGDGNWAVSYWSTETTRDPEATHTVTVRVDATPPLTTANVGSPVSQPSLVLTAIDPPTALGEPLSGVGSTWYSFDGAAEAVYNALSPPAVPRGVHSVAWHSHDNAGNEEVAQAGTIISGPQAYVRKPAGRSSVRVRRSLTFSGKLTRAANHRRLTLLAYRFNGVDWVLTRTKSVLIHTPRRRGLSSYGGSIKFTAKGSWKVIARYEGDGYWVQSWSAPKYVTVR